MKITCSIVLALVVAAASWVCTVNGISAQNPPAPKLSSNSEPAKQETGLIRNDPGAFQGYTLISPMQSKTSFLIDMNGRVVKSWATAVR